MKWPKQKVIASITPKLPMVTKNIDSHYPRIIKTSRLKYESMIPSSIKYNTVKCDSGHSIAIFKSNCMFPQDPMKFRAR